MILGDPNATDPGSDPTTTLDTLFRRAAKRRPDAIALADPPNRERFSHGRPRRLTYAEADRAVTAIAARLRRLGLPADAIIGIQLPNTVECALTLLGVLRAGLIAVPLPLLWGRAEMAATLGRLGAKAIVTADSAGGGDLCANAMQVAANIFAIRFVCSFGPRLPDGVISFDSLLDAEAGECPVIERERPAAHQAVVTVEITPDGPVMVGRNHAQLIAGGLATLLEGRLQQDARLLGCCAMSSFAGLALTLIPWLLSGGTLSLHHGFDPQAFTQQCRDDRCDTVVVPGPLVQRLDEAGLLADAHLKRVLAFWRAPEALAQSRPWRNAQVTLTDMLAFGEIALLGSQRSASGETVPLPHGVITAPRGSTGGLSIAEMARTEAGTVALRGSTVPRHAFPPGRPGLAVDTAGFVDTRYACRLDTASGSFIVTAPPPGIAAVGGYRFALGGIEALLRNADPAAFVTALPDALAGQRFAGMSGSGGDLRRKLQGLGANPLLAEAFADRPNPRPPDRIEPR